MGEGQKGKVLRSSARGIQQLGMNLDGWNCRVQGYFIFSTAKCKGRRTQRCVGENYQDKGGTAPHDI
jgi:hypothetical protein